MGSSKVSSPTGDRDAEVAKLRERVNDLERERERLIHSTRKAENMADKNYLLTQQCFSMIKNKEDKNDKQDTEVAQLLREAKAKAERAEENANVQVRNLQAKLDEMSKRALEAENALKDEKHQRETDGIRFRADVDKNSERVKENQMLKERFQKAIETITTLQKELKQVRAATQASSERETNLIQLLQDVNSLVAGIVSNSHEMSNRLTSCCSSLGRMKEEGCRGPTRFLPGADLDKVRHQVKESGKLVVKRSLEDQFFFSIVTTTGEDRLCRQLKRLYLDVSAEAEVVGNQLELAQESHEACESYVEVWKGYYNEWVADQAELAVSVTEAVDELSAQNLPKSENSVMSSASILRRT
ncbi:hypothetical protein PHYSODRAFT_246653 [Phytophthora sojae]|uniref:Uncharacterized protein n=1 Tax=Phytophthora sojae (strain P6497) TaxID=1094619 RepID=G5AD11_PHYSP|nr:hypothetical protein PHYSODRAFT_246653 [Phytophthora sojae]EGZ06065.1 hypothetical protein PHYSODRAFT_246653 [Phytophthora sojae]|eukprot:XP_009537962.1 hypothetical protein PHYSODRAFT_246653 [Phytophthora sojae]